MKKIISVLIVLLIIIGVGGFTYNYKCTSCKTPGNKTDNYEVANVINFNTCESKFDVTTNMELNRFIDNIQKKESDKIIVKCDMITSVVDSNILGHIYSDICYTNDDIYKLENNELIKLDLPKYTDIKNSYNFSDVDGDKTLYALFLDKNNGVYLLNSATKTVTKIDVKDNKIKYLTGVSFSKSDTEKLYTFIMVTLDGKALTLGLNDITNYETYKNYGMFKNDETILTTVYMNDKNNIMVYDEKNQSFGITEPKEIKINDKLVTATNLIIRKNSLMFTMDNKLYTYDISTDLVKLYNDKTIKSTDVTYDENASKTNVLNEVNYCSTKTVNKFTIVYTDNTSEEFTN